MSSYEAQPEDLPPLELTQLRELDVVEPDHPDRPAHVAEASGIAKRGDWVYAVGDDMLHLSAFRLSSEEPGTLRKALTGELPTDEDERKGEKPDLEAIGVMPPFPGHPHGLILGIGSGSDDSGRARDRGFAWSFDRDGSLRGEPMEIDLNPVYTLLRSEIDGLNIEGAAVVGDRLWLLQRGNRGGPNAVAELSLREVERSLHSDLEIDAHELADLRTYDLGDLNGVPLCFSDGAALPTGELVFTASAERDEVADGEDEIEGSVVGTIEPDGTVRRLRTIDRRWKVEGVHATLDTGVLDLLFVCDQDDPDHGSPLLSATMPLDGDHER
ncbi:MAG: DUF6929 family protein [Solirubrobacterales bacterium]